MIIRLEITIQDEGRLDGAALAQLLNHTENLCRNAAAITAIQIGTVDELPAHLIQLALIRIWSHEEGFFWIEDIRLGSKILYGQIIAGAVIGMVLNSTIGESLKEGWRHTESHKYISRSISDIEKMFVDQFRELFDSSRAPIDDKFYVTPVAIRHDEESEETTVNIRTRQKRTGPASEKQL